MRVPPAALSLAAPAPAPALHRAPYASCFWQISAPANAEHASRTLGAAQASGCEFQEPRSWRIFNSRQPSLLVLPATCLLALPCALRRTAVAASVAVRRPVAVAASLPSADEMSVSDPADSGLVRQMLTRRLRMHREHDAHSGPRRLVGLPRPRPSFQQPSSLQAPLVDY